MPQGKVLLEKDALWFDPKNIYTGLILLSAMLHLCSPPCYIYVRPLISIPSYYTTCEAKKPNSLNSILPFTGLQRLGRSPSPPQTNQPSTFWFLKALRKTYKWYIWPVWHWHKTLGHGNGHATVYFSIILPLVQMPLCHILESRHNCVFFYLGFKKLSWLIIVDTGGAMVEGEL